MPNSSGTSVHRTLVIGTASPTRCGIATYTSHLTSALRDSGIDADILRVVEDPIDGVARGEDVIATWFHHDASGASISASRCDDYDTVLIQHEFGIYPGRDGADVVDFVREVHRPVTMVMHTVLESPTDHQRFIVDELLDHSAAVVVHGTSARARLLRTHDVPAAKINLIPHGAVAVDDDEDRGPSSPPFALTYGLIGPGKGIEHAIEAIALLRSAGIDLDYVVAGATHPTVLAREGERYRNRLRRQARVLGVDDLVHFDDRYRDADAQSALVANAAVVVLPYDSHDQVTSGVLVEAIAAGRPVVATAFPHAVELASTGAVAVVPHESSDELAHALVRAAIDQTSAAWMRRCAHACGVEHDWRTVARAFSETLRRTNDRAEVAR